MPRQTTAEIELEIVDRAAALFARHGFRETSLQQIATATGYSKAGLLHHFPSKEAVYRAALHATRNRINEIVAAVEQTAPGPSRDVALLERLVDSTLSAPGLSALANSLIGSDRLEDPDLIDIGLALLTAFDVDLDHPDDGRLVRILSAVAGLTVAGVEAVRLGLARDWRGHIIAAAADGLGVGVGVGAAGPSVPRT